MYLLYLDDSGSIGDKSTKFFVLAGFSIFERQTHWLDSSVTEIAKRFSPLNPECIELHASPMRVGREGWQNFAPADRVQAVVDVLHLLSVRQLGIKVFASVIEKSLMTPDLIMSRAFEEIAVRFDSYLAHQHKVGSSQRGLVIFDKSTSEREVQRMSYILKHEGHSHGKLRNFAEVPLFLDSKASRLIQVADLIAYWIYRRYEAGDDQGFKLIAPFFHGYKGGQQGLFELISAEAQAALATTKTYAHPFPSPTPAGTVLPPANPQPRRQTTK